MEAARALPVRPFNTRSRSSPLTTSAGTCLEYGGVKLDEAIRHLVEVVHPFHVGAPFFPEPLAQLEGLHQGTELLHEIVLRRGNDRHLHAESLFRLRHGHGIEMRDD